MSSIRQRLSDHFRKDDSVLADFLWVAEQCKAFSVVRSGWFTKRGSVRTNWKRRHVFYLKPGVIVYADGASAMDEIAGVLSKELHTVDDGQIHRACERAAKMVKGTCRVTGLSDVCLLAEFDRKRNVLCVKAPEPSERVFFFSCGDREDEAAAWSRLIHDRQEEVVREERRARGEDVPSPRPSPAEHKTAEPVARGRRVSSVWVLGETERIEQFYTLGAALGQPGQFGRAVVGTRLAAAEPDDLPAVDEADGPPGRGAALAQLEQRRRPLWRHRGRCAGRERGRQGDQQVALLCVAEPRARRGRVPLVPPGGGDHAAATHRHIVRFHDAFEDRESFYIVMELCRGGELFERITSRGQYSEADAAGVMRMVVSAVDYMHQKRIAHCDLKPDNFIFDRPGDDADIKIIDFGMSKFVRPRHYLTRFCGTPYYVAPDVINGQYTESCDIWSLGVILFVMLFGYPCFYANPAEHGRDTDSRIYQLILAGFDAAVRPGYGPHFPADMPVSDSARDLVARMLDSNSRTRPTAAEVMEHPWMNGGADDKPLSGAVLDGLRKFQAGTRFKAAVLQFMARTLDEHDKDRIDSTFRTMDKNGDGMLSREELLAGMRRIDPAFSEEEADKVLRGADLDADGTISYEELTATFVQRKINAKEERLWDSFCKLDVNKDGRITAQELKAVLGEEDLSQCAQLIREVDADGDGSIDYSEFLTMWMGGGAERRLEGAVEAAVAATEAEEQ